MDLITSVFLATFIVTLISTIVFAYLYINETSEGPKNPVFPSATQTQVTVIPPGPEPGPGPAPAPSIIPKQPSFTVTEQAAPPGITSQFYFGWIVTFNSFARSGAAAYLDDQNHVAQPLVFTVDSEHKITVTGEGLGGNCQSLVTSKSTTQAFIGNNVFSGEGRTQNQRTFLWNADTSKWDAVESNFQVGEAVLDFFEFDGIMYRAVIEYTSNTEHTLRFDQYNGSAFVVNSTFSGLLPSTIRGSFAQSGENAGRFFLGTQRSNQKQNSGVNMYSFSTESRRWTGSGYRVLYASPFQQNCSVGASPDGSSLLIAHNRPRPGFACQDVASIFTLATEGVNAGRYELQASVGTNAMSNQSCDSQQSVERPLKTGPLIVTPDFKMMGVVYGSTGDPTILVYRMVEATSVLPFQLFAGSEALDTGDPAAIRLTIPGGNIFLNHSAPSTDDWDFFQPHLTDLDDSRYALFTTSNHRLIMKVMQK